VVNNLTAGWSDNSRVGPTTTNYNEGYDNAWYKKGAKNINTILFNLRKGSGIHKGVQSRSLALWQKVYERQQLQKGSLVAFTNKKNTREKFGRRAQFVAAVVCYSLQKERFHYTLADINAASEDGRHVTSKMVRNALKSLDIYNLNKV